MSVKGTKYYGDIEVCATCGTGQLTRLRDGMIRKHKREVWENGQWTGSHEHCPGSGQPHIDLVAANNARSTQAEPQEPTVTDTDFTPGQRIVVADGSTHTVVKMYRWANEPLRVEVEGGLQWLAENCEPVPERTEATDRLDQLRADLDRTTVECEEQIERSRTLSVLNEAALASGAEALTDNQRPRPTDYPAEFIGRVAAEQVLSAAQAEPSQLQTPDLIAKLKTVMDVITRTDNTSSLADLARHAGSLWWELEVRGEV